MRRKENCDNMMHKSSDTIPRSDDIATESSKIEEALSRAGSAPITTSPVEWKESDPRDLKGKDPNFVYRLLSKKRVARDGGDTRGWAPVRADGSEHPPDVHFSLNGNNLCSEKPVDNLIHVGDSFFGKMPREKAEARARFMAQKGQTQIESLKERAENHEKMLRDAGMSKDEARRVAANQSGYMSIKGGYRPM